MKKYIVLDNLVGKTKKPKKLVCSYFEKELKMIKSADIQNFAIELLRMAPGYFFTAPSNSSGKHHPSYEFSTGGLILHTKAVVYFLNQLTELEEYSVTERKKDLLIVAALLHDCKKHGDKPQGKYTNFEHPRLAANLVRMYSDCGVVAKEEVHFIADAIEAHSGQWNTNGKKSKYESLPKPETTAQKVLHISDFLASREEINLQKYLDAEKIDYSMLTLKVGKYKGQTVYEIAEFDIDYLAWVYDTDMENVRKGRRTMTSPYIREALKSILFDSDFKHDDFITDSDNITSCGQISFAL